MKSIHVNIKKLGLIRNAEIEIKPLMLFSGYSGLGKSYVAILCHYFFHVWLNGNRLDSLFKNIQESLRFSFSDSNIDREIASFSLEKSYIEERLANDAVEYLKFMLGYSELKAEIEVKLPIEEDQFDFKYDQEIIGVEDNTEIYNKISVLGLTYRFKDSGITDESPYSLVFRFAMIKNLFGDHNNLKYYFVFPPTRGMYMSEFPMINNVKTGLCQSFVYDMLELNKAQEIPDKVDSNLINLVHKVLAGDVKLEGGQYVYITHGIKLPISAAAASVRELGSLQQMIKKCDISKSAILIEEPESHLHPLKQIQMADIIALMARSGANMQITTHSDYFMRRLNDLIRLHILKEKDEQKYNELRKEFNISNVTLDPSILSAYYLEQTEVDGDVTLKKQDVSSGIPFDTFDSANDKPLDLSVMLYELTVQGNEK